MCRLKEGKISSHGLLYILMTLIITKFFLGLPRAMAEEGGSAGWLLILLAAGWAAIGILFLVKLLTRFPGKNLVEITEAVWGRPGAILVSLILSFLFFFMAAIVVREFGETMLTTVLPRTPISVIIFTFIVVMIMGAYNGLEVITRCTTLIFPFIMLGIVSILLLTLNYANINNLFPVLGTGLGQITYHAPGRSSIFLEIIFAGVIFSNISDPEKVPLQIWKAFAYSLVMFILVQLFYTAVISVAAAEKLYVPLFQMARIIYMGRFVQRIEALYIFVWFFTAAINLTLSLYGAATLLSRGFKIPIYQPLLFSLGLLVFTVSFIPAGIVTAVSFDMDIIREYGAVIAWGIPLGLLLTSVIRKKGGAQSDPKIKN